MLDSFNRDIDYMRVSITDRCNLRCGYCMPSEFTHIAHDDILRYEEILRACEIMASTGIKIIRVTGGEPLTRKGCVNFIGRLKSIPGIERVTMTTNAILLEQYIDELVVCGLDGLNISLDSLNPKTYERITGKDELCTVLASLRKALNVGLGIKINCVIMKNLNDDDVLPIVRMAETMPVDIRFIELMPTMWGRRFEGVTGEEIFSILQGEYPDLTLDLLKRGSGPAKYYNSSSLMGSIGLINAVSGHICSDCNRLRLTSEGFLKLCLNFDKGLDLRKMLRGGASDIEIRDAVATAIREKPKQYNFNSGSVGIERMSNIGG